MAATSDFLVRLAFVGIGAMAGAMLRFVLQSVVYSGSSPWLPILGINLTGCFIIGVLWVMLNYFSAPAWLVALLMPGLLGGFTTFSSFSLDFIALIRDSRLCTAALYWSASAVAGPLLCALGYWLTSKTLDL
ncbi:MAG: CrcB family protein [Bacteroidales bacterium]|nr:CrcB family protein [Bacteroidales bacterium]